MVLRLQALRQGHCARRTRQWSPRHSEVQHLGPPPALSEPTSPSPGAGPISSGAVIYVACHRALRPVTASSSPKNTRRRDRMLDPAGLTEAPATRGGLSLPRPVTLNARRQRRRPRGPPLPLGRSPRPAPRTVAASPSSFGPGGGQGPPERTSGPERVFLGTRHERFDVE